MNNNISRQSSFSSLNAQSSLQDFEKWGDALKKTTKNLEGHKVTAQLTSNVNKTPYTVEDIIRISSNALKNLSEIYRNSSSEEQKQIYKTMADINNNTLNFIDQYEAQKTGSAFFTKHFKNIEKKMILGLSGKKTLYTSQLSTKVKRAGK